MSDKPTIVHITMSDARYEEEFKKENHYRERSVAPPANIALTVTTVTSTSPLTVIHTNRSPSRPLPSAISTNPRRSPNENLRNLRLQG